jgi:hypothetical protein
MGGKDLGWQGHVGFCVSHTVRFVIPSSVNSLLI